jgi:hypothetical protein
MPIREQPEFNAGAEIVWRQTRSCPDPYPEFVNKGLTIVSFSLKYWG